MMEFIKMYETFYSTEKQVEMFDEKLKWGPWSYIKKL